MATKKMTTAKKATTTTTKRKAKGSGRAARPTGDDVGSGGAVVNVADAVARACADGFFAPLSNDHPYLKVGIDGKAGDGKTQTLAELAIGIWRRVQSTKPVVILDTENARRFLVPLFDAAKVPVVVRPVRSLVEWVDAVHRAVDGAADVVITDSLTHLWEDTMAAFCQARGVDGVEGPAAWLALKEVWHREWAALFRDAPVHLLFAARSADNYVDVLGKDGHFESAKVGTKMRGEAEVAFEPSLLVHLRRDGGVVFAEVEKDRTDTLHGQTVALPLGGIFGVFAGVVDATLAGAVAPVAIEQRSSVSLFADGGGARSRCRGLVGDVRGLLDRTWPSASAADRQTRANAMHEAFGHSSWPRIERTDEGALKAGLQRLVGIVAAGGPTTTPTPSPDAAVATIRAGLSNDPGDPTTRTKQLAAARLLAATLPQPHRASALGIIANAAARFERADVDQRDPFNGDELPC